MRVFKESVDKLYHEENKTWNKETCVANRLFASQPKSYIALMEKFFPSKTKLKIIE